jgi:hypothetical protein
MTDTPTHTTPRKAWYRSRTLWFNLLVALLGTAELSLGLLAPVLGEAVYPVLAFALALGNAVLRVLTKLPLALRAPAGPAAADEWEGDRP